MDIGPTEATIYIATGEITKEDINNDKIYIGTPVIGDKIEIRNKKGKIYQLDARGSYIC